MERSKSGQSAVPILFIPTLGNQVIRSVVRYSPKCLTILQYSQHLCLTNPCLFSDCFLENLTKLTEIGMVWELTASGAELGAMIMSAKADLTQ